MPQYYRINLKDKMGNICYPNIDPNISIDTEGNVIIQKKLTVNNGLFFDKGLVATNLNDYKFKLTRWAGDPGDDEFVEHFLSDKYYDISYTNDETNSNIRFTLINTDAENSDGSNANTSVVTFSGSSDGSVITADYLSLAKYIEFAKDQYYRDGIYVLNLNNSDIVGLNGLYFYDTAESPREGLRWKRTNENWDSLYAKDGTLFFAPDSTTAAETFTTYKVITSAGGTIAGDLYFANGTTYYAGSNGNCKFKTGAFTEGLTVSTYSATINSQRIALVKSDGTYWGLIAPDGSESSYYRTTKNGFIPYNAKSSTSRANSYLGTSSWPFYACYADNFYGTFNGNATSATSATSATTAGDASMTIVAQNSNEVNFGGTNTSTTIYFGYRAAGSKAKPTAFVFGNTSTLADVTTGLIKATKNSNTVTIGSQNSSCCHIYNSANIPFYFNRSIQINGDEVLVKNSYTLTHPGRPQLSFSPWTSKLIDLNTCLASSGNDLSYSSNGIKCGRAMKVAISAQVCLWNFAASETDLLVYKNSTEILQAHTNVISGMGLVNVCIAPTVISAAAGDVFTMRVVTGASGAFTIIADGKDTHLTLQEV